LAVDTGLGREGARSTSAAAQTAAIIAQQANLDLRGLYTHEGHAYTTAPADQPALVTPIMDTLVAARDAIDPSLTLWPGCSVTARALAAHPATHAVRPGAYVFGDLYLSDVTGAMAFTDSALTVLATVVDRPEPGLALIDAGSKVFGQDRTAAGHHARSADGRDLFVTRCNEEHGYLTGPDVDWLVIGDRVEFVPAHVCPVVNLTDTVLVVEAGLVVARWTVDARGCVI
jgi:D-serine deaminase-like pyridoxal phosphate-dependent protein